MLNIDLPYELALLLLGIYTHAKWNHMFIQNFTLGLFIAAVFLIAESEFSYE